MIMIIDISTSTTMSRRVVADLECAAIFLKCFVVIIAHPTTDLVRHYDVAFAEED